MKAARFTTILFLTFGTFYSLVNLYDAGKDEEKSSYANEKAGLKARVAFLEGLTSALEKKFVDGFLPHMAASLHYSVAHKAELMKLDPDILEGMLLVDYQPEGNLMVVYTTIMDEATGVFDTVVEIDRKTLKRLNWRKIPREKQ